MVSHRKHNRRSIRLKNYDYSKPGYYYVTICTADRVRLFGKILNGEMQLNGFGRIANSEWLRTEDLRKNVRLDEFVVMPNHIHGIIILTKKINTESTTINEFKSPSKNLGAIVRGYKSAVTKQVNKINKQPGEKIWQRNYYERIIRNTRELNAVRNYIRNNPVNWDRDKLNNR